MAKIKHIKTPEEIAYLATFGKELSNLLKRLKLSQIEFGIILNVHKNSVNKWVKGINYPQPLILKKIIEYFLTNPKIKDFNPYTLLLAGSYNKYKSSKYDFIINELKNNFENEKLELKNQLETKYNSKIDKMKATNKKLSNENWRIREVLDLEQKYYTKLDKLNIEKENYKQQIQVEVKAQEIEKINKEILNKLKWFPDRLVNKILDNRDISNFLNNISVKERIIYQDVRDRFANLLSEKICYEMYYILKGIYNPDTNCDNNE